MTSAVIQVLGLVVVIVFAVVVGTVAIIVQRKFGSKWLWVVWLVPGVMVTGFFLTRVDYNVHSIWSRPVLSFAASQFLLWSGLAAIVVWHTGVWFGPRPLTVPAGKLQDEQGLTGILGCYQKLLAMYATALEAAGRFNPCPSVWDAFLGTFRGFLPSSTRQGLERVRQMGQVPNILGMALIGPEDVLAELETLTPAQFSAIEACHRINVRRLRQRSVFGWRWRSMLAGLIAAITGLVYAAEHVGILKLRDIDLWPLISGITVRGSDIPSSIFRGVLGLLFVGLMWIIRDGICYIPLLQRLQAFEDILTIAKAYRKGSAATTELKAQKESIDDPESMWR